MSSDVRIDGNRLQITRTFAAPRAVVFAFWSQPDKLAQWSGCKDASDCTVEMDFRVGGSFTQTMKVRGSEFIVRGTYDEIIAPEKISYQVDLGPGGIGRVVIDFIEHGTSTTVVLTQDGLPNEMICNIVSQGTVESFDKLGRVLAPQTV